MDYLCIHNMLFLTKHTELPSKSRQPQMMMMMMECTKTEAMSASYAEVGVTHVFNVSVPGVCDELEHHAGGISALHMLYLCTQVE